ncbi:2Fe-2S iron-sulfur cluster-binding protein [Streptomyces caniscabiei]|uniref:(2Fe-2S)-binding protein n=1 Tax=Streptomyces caniscabiei TaxID=2746961 RepID=A0A927L4I9_9ACTN|nr:2Fe-2S iron-sulfur cluster-binding protein [Streptomyces caniscabiei]MBD9725392.1 (2Fe-2S)-binding protein [Streptomyces caniscabiei]MDX3510945.1 2Fe-2S iron-sulfur cluster-binding protein [Streptomyces caniscabiei]MDX3720111.1 2Fe-2S iron-sulfur cluster-binding protein [Streptomyces caniscabiei]MDX3729295.1 2Fe-2S iron-sulfur cluster-binding protein [Streptomyces caniscabiei]WEO29223.1 2Fe-2S iron-sulfur cluster-binding protein [Streptomyces caniscabiei]
MPIVIFQSPDGTPHKVTAESGTALMRAAVSHGVEGIVAECGGNASCATCHVYVDEQHTGLVGPPNDVEEEMLDFTAAERRPTSRLSCQIQLSDALDGLIVHVPEEQV